MQELRAALFAKNFEWVYDLRETGRKRVKSMITTGTNITLKLAETPVELRAAQRLRYRIFVTEMGGSTDQASAGLGIERDAYDAHFDHLIL